MRARSRLRYSTAAAIAKYGSACILSAMMIVHHGDSVIKRQALKKRLHETTIKMQDRPSVRVLFAGKQEAW